MRGRLDEIEASWRQTVEMEQRDWETSDQALVIRAVRQLGAISKYSRHWITCSYLNTDEDGKICSCGWLLELEAIDSDVLSLLEVEDGTA